MNVNKQSSDSTLAISVVDFCKKFSTVINAVYKQANGRKLVGWTKVNDTQLMNLTKFANDNRVFELTNEGESLGNYWLAIKPKDTRYVKDGKAMYKANNSFELVPIKPTEEASSQADISKLLG